MTSCRSGHVAAGTWIFQVPRVPPGPNARLHWRARHRQCAPLRDGLAYEVKVTLPAGHVPLRHAAVTMILYRRGGPPMDPDNAVATVKPLVDALVIGGLLETDRYITLSVQQEYCPQARGVRVEVTA